VRATSFWSANAAKTIRELRAGVHPTSMSRGRPDSELPGTSKDVKRRACAAVPSAVVTPDAARFSVRDLRRHARLPVVLLLLLGVICAWTLWAPPAGRTSWALEVGPGLIEVAILMATYRRLPLSHLVYGAVFVHLLVLIYGGYHTYALTPLGDWAKQTFGLARNHYDRVGHVALGIFPIFLAREVLLRASPLGRSKWLAVLSVSLVFSFAAFWELLEWWVTLLVAADVGQAFLGSQGDVWDAQWDMLLALLGAIGALALASGVHDRSLTHVPARSPCAGA
jgi:putative membrane protein